MSIQEAALHGDLVLYLRDYVAELLAGEDGDIDEMVEWLDGVIREWFLTPQPGLHGFAPRDLIYAEMRGEPNPIHPDHLDVFLVDDCPICQASLEEAEASLEAGEDPGWQWYYDPGGWPLIAQYDPEGWDEFWCEEEDALEGWPFDEETEDGSAFEPLLPSHSEPLPVEPGEVSVEEFMARLRRPGLDPTLHGATLELMKRADCPEPSLFGFRYRPLTYEEGLSLLVGLQEQGVDVERLVAQIDAFPYERVALDWLSRPEENVALMIEAIEREIVPDEEAERERFRHHRDFVFALSRVVPLGARLWLQGWLEGVGHGAFGCVGREEVDDLF